MSSGVPLQRVSLTSSTSDDHARIAVLEGIVNQLAASMTTNMAELFALLRGPNSASSSSTPPSGQGPTADPISWIPPTQVLENTNVPAPPTTHTAAAHPFTILYQPPLAPVAVPLPPAAFLTTDQVLSAPLPVSMPTPAAASTVPPPTIFPVPSAPAPTHPQATDLPSYPPLQPHINFPYQAPPPINTTFLEPGTPTHAAQFASPTHFLPEVDAEQERRLKRMEETMRALQANEARPDASYGDCSLFPGMLLPSKFKFPEFKTYEALDWFMSLKAEDIPTWADLSRKFINQYQYCAETPPTLLELSMKEKAHGQRFEEYATKWRAQAAKHIPQISEVQQIQLFHSILREVYYSHLLAHTSSFFDLIEAGKKLDLGIKLGRMEGPTNKGEEPSRKASAMSTSSSGRKGKEVTVNAVNPAHPTPQQYSVNVTSTPPVVPTYAPQYRPQPPTQRSTTLHYHLYPHLRYRRSSSTLCPYSTPSPSIPTPGSEGFSANPTSPAPARSTERCSTTVTTQAIPVLAGPTFPHLRANP
ncbi:max-binding protein MNT-like [Punica granatum]|uniref:Max-binding protein MNT-like n=1 Tax=Punica granatum TaxID=22663 RepID=A0A6P8D0K8_PUNGR|nr:max-binding protein MNT-like [Punica granatum]